MQEMRVAIRAGDFADYYRCKRDELMRTDDDNPNRPPKKNKSTQSPRLGNYELHHAPKGYYSIRQISSGEIMHSVNPPNEEANRLYIEQSALAARLRTADNDPGELIIWDVGLGAATNAMAAVHCFERCYAENRGVNLRPLRLVSFEIDLDALKLAAKHAAYFPHLHHGAPSQILAHGSWQHDSELLSWELLQGDFRDFIDTAAQPDLIFYDPFSYKTDDELWTDGIFARIFQRCSTKPAELYTYSASTAVRVALLCASFCVALGVGTGPKSETTIAFTELGGAVGHPLKPPLLDHKWLTRWRRSGARFPPSITAAQQAEFANVIEGHRQFSPTGR
jgi:queuine tRNA-ribosyltransferase